MRQRSSRSSSTPWHKSTSANSAYAFAGLAAFLAIVLFMLRGEPVKPGLKVARDKPPSAPANVQRSWKRVAIGPLKGVVATEDISAGTLIILDTPFIEIPEAENRTMAAQYLLESVDRLSTAAKSDYFNLPFTSAHLSKGAEAAELAVNIFESNAITAGKTSALFKNACYINHSCNPNADFFYRDDLNALVVQAVKPIAKGEEIFAPLFDSSVMTRDERQTHMHDTRGVACECSACSLKGEALKESDARRTQLGDIRQRILQWGEGEAGEVDPQEVITGVETAYQLLVEEDYRADLGWWAGSAVQVCAAHEDEEGAKKWAKIAAEHYSLEAGSDSPQVRSLNIIAQFPQRANVWGARTVKPEEDLVDHDSLDDESTTDESESQETLVGEELTEEAEAPESSD